MNIEQARINMIKQQIRTWDVTDNKVLETLAAVPREEFVDPEYKDLAFADTSLPLAHNEVMLSPKIEGKMLQALNIQPHETVLEIGTGSGYFTALLAKFAKHVYSVEFYSDLSQNAAAQLKKHRINNVTLEIGNAAKGWNYHAQEVDVLVITGSLPFLPEAFKSCLKESGRLMAILGDAPSMEVSLINKNNQKWSAQKVFETVAPPLLYAQQPERFVF
ncbi:MAG: protein-L-isoaspartate(D-aspartate) O-methyltransferase [Gammaproteobacteria bacterium]|jgi:protein-L-isoaspartate(D-aspartate) O-methyltransferase|nr:protein-L-isoaspartate(D-aspartate) O-methyltransferase [Gammaproteobacteria bacterium]